MQRTQTVIDSLKFSGVPSGSGRVSLMAFRRADWERSALAQDRQEPKCSSSSAPRIPSALPARYGAAWASAFSQSNGHAPWASAARGEAAQGRSWAWATSSRCMSFRARWILDMTVPMGHPTISAISR